MGPRKNCRYACHCLKVTEEAVIEAIRAHEIRDVEDIIRYTQAGDGCTACHSNLERLCEREARCPKATSPESRPSARPDTPQALPV
jgi:NAD(P)H-nitrite reductase large subunit